MSGFTQRALIVELWGLGDGVLATPMLQALRERAIPVTLLCKASTAALLRPSYPQVDFLPLTAPWTAFRGKYRLWKWPWFTLISTVLQLRRQHFDIAVSVRDDPRDHLLMWLAGARRRVGFPRAGSRLFLSKPARPGPVCEHIVRRWWRLERTLFGSSLEFSPRIAPPTHRADSAHLLPILCIHCGAQIPVRRWPETSFAEMLRRVRATFDCRIVLIPDPDGYGRSLATAADATRENLDFPGLVRSLAEATAVLANDSGPAHLADALGTPVAAVFGPQTPSRFRPFSERNIVLVADICPYRPCSDYCRYPEPLCLTELTVDTVWPEFRNFLIATGFSPRQPPLKAAQ